LAKVTQLILKHFSSISSSLVTTLRAAETFSEDHLHKPEIKALIDHAKFFYIGGFFLTHGIDSAIHIAKIASGRGRVRGRGSLLKKKKRKEKPDNAINIAGRLPQFVGSVYPSILQSPA
jgi:hypothetical protein